MLKIHTEIIHVLLSGRPTVKPTHGKRINEGVYLTTPYGSLHSYICSECGAYIIIESYDNFCPNCGAKMEDEQE